MFISNNASSLCACSNFLPFVKYTLWLLSFPNNISNYLSLSLLLSVVRHIGPSSSLISAMTLTWLLAYNALVKLHIFPLHIAIIIFSRNLCCVHFVIYIIIISSLFSNLLSPLSLSLSVFRNHSWMSEGWGWLGWIWEGGEGFCFFFLKKCQLFSHTST